MLNINNFIKAAQKLNHLDLSGMNLKGEALVFLAHTLSCATFISTIHLNHNQIAISSSELKDEILDIFGIDVQANNNYDQ